MKRTTRRPATTPMILVNCRFCSSTVFRVDLRAIRTCHRCDRENVHAIHSAARPWSRWLVRRNLRLQRQQQDWAWEV